MKIETWQVIDALELEKLIEETYGRKFSVLRWCMDGEGCNGSVHAISVPWGDDWTWDDEFSYGTKPPRLADWAAERKPTERQGYPAKWAYDDAEPPAFGEIIDDLHERGLIPAGNYQLHAWW